MITHLSCHIFYFCYWIELLYELSSTEPVWPGWWWCSFLHWCLLCLWWWRLTQTRPIVDVDVTIAGATCHTAFKTVLSGLHFPFGLYPNLQVFSLISRNQVGVRVIQIKVHCDHSALSSVCDTKPFSLWYFFWKHLPGNKYSGRTSGPWWFWKDKNSKSAIQRKRSPLMLPS